jgi:DNA-binding beta-propeller fold protein YncE
MKINSRSNSRALLVVALMLIVTIASTRLKADSGTCGGATTTLPFTDVAGNPFFCEIAEAFFSELTNGTTPTTYSPAQNVPREQMAAFITRTLDQSLKRGSRRAALKQFWTPMSADGLGLTSVASGVAFIESDGADVWASNGSNGVSRVRASDGKLLGTWSGATKAIGVLAAKGLVFATGETVAGSLYQIDPTQPPGVVTTLTNSLGDNPVGISFDGARVWTANLGGPGSVSIVTLNPLSVTTVTEGFSGPFGILYDGANIWVTERAGLPGKLFKLDRTGAIIQSVTVGDFPESPVFDGTNIWVPNLVSSTVTVVRASTGAVLATLTGNGLSSPVTAAFDGERILVTNNNFQNGSVSLWKAADLSPLGSVNTGPHSEPVGACSDGLNFWIALLGTNQLARL